MRTRVRRACLLLLGSALIGCATMTPEEGCPRVCSQQGLVYRGVNKTPATPTEPARASCVCGLVQPAGTANAPAPAPAERTGCMKDTDCKGDRVCDQGICKAPAPK